MALKRGFCSHCKGDETLRIFDVNKEAEVCYCPNCMAEMQPKEAIENYSALISHYLKKGSKALFESTQYLVAYQTFAHILDLDESIRVARLGRILSLVYVSSLRKAKISFAFMLHRQEAPKYFHYQETANEYFHFLILLLDALDLYENRLKKRITTHSGIYYDLDCVVTYLQRIDEIKRYKSFISLEATFFIESNKPQFNDVIKKIYQSAPLYENALKKEYVTLDGYTYLFVKYDSNGAPIVSIKSAKQNIEFHHKPMQLYPKDKKIPALKDDVYQNNLTLSRLVSLSIPLAYISFGVALAGVIAAIILESDVAKILLIFGAVSLVIFSLILFILHFSWKNRLKKKYYNGTNPFIFK